MVQVSRPLYIKKEVPMDYSKELVVSKKQRQNNHRKNNK